MSFDSKPHRRYNPLTGEWLLVSPHRAERPWSGEKENAASPAKPAYDPKCYLCPGNDRVGGIKNPNYRSVYIFDNDFQALLADTPEEGENAHPLFRAESVQGTCKVICYSPRHDLSLANMPAEQIRDLVDAWCALSDELFSRYVSVQIFENKGSAMGASNPHPHGQVWSGNFLPTLVAKEENRQREYFEKYGQKLLQAYLEEEKKRNVRIVLENDHWCVLVPYWAVWPYETILIPKSPALSRLPELNPPEKAGLADILQKLTAKYDRLFNTPFPYSMGFHQAPMIRGSEKHWGLHAHFFPPLLRSASVKKFMVGFEMLAESQRDIPAETAAKILRNLP